jgi:hypothetical protein
LIEKKLEKRPPQSAKEAGAIIEELTASNEAQRKYASFSKKRDPALENRKHSLQGRSRRSKEIHANNDGTRNVLSETW